MPLAVAEHERSGCGEIGGAVQPGGREFLCGARVTVAGHEVVACYRAVQGGACAAAAAPGPALKGRCAMNPAPRRKPIECPKRGPLHN